MSVKEPREQCAPHGRTWCVECTPPNAWKDYPATRRSRVLSERHALVQRAKAALDRSLPDDVKQVIGDLLIEVREAPLRAEEAP